MTDQSTAGTQNATGTDPNNAQVVTGNDARSMFGLPTSGSGDPGANTGGADTNKPAADPKTITSPSGTADPNKPAADPKAGDQSSGTAGTDSQSGAAKKWGRGKYETPEALELAYGELESHRGKLEGENKDYRTKLQQTEAKLAELEKSFQERARTVEVTPDSEEVKAFLKKNPILARQVERLAEREGQDFANEHLLSEFERERRLDERLESQNRQAAKEQQAQEKARQYEEAKKAFFDGRPEAKQLETDMEEAANVWATRIDDPAFAMDILYGLALVRKLPEVVDRLVSDGVKQRLQTEVNRNAAGGIVSGAGAVGQRTVPGGVQVVDGTRVDSTTGKFAMP